MSKTIEQLIEENKELKSENRKLKNFLKKFKYTESGWCNFRFNGGPCHNQKMRTNVSYERLVVDSSKKDVEKEYSLEGSPSYEEYVKFIKGL